MINSFVKKIVSVADKKFSIKDVILFEAHIMGGIHAEAPKNEIQNALVNINNFLSIHDKQSSLIQVKAIANNILQALKPLKNSVIEKYRA